MNTGAFSFHRKNQFLGRVSRVLLGGALSAVLLLGACGGDDVDRGPTTIAVNAKLNGLYWDSGESKLYLTDDATNSIKVWNGDVGFDVSARLPPPPASGATLGQLTRTKDGTFYTTRFGFGTDGTVIAVPKAGAGAPYNLIGLDPLRRRIGITTAPDGTLVEGWFIKGATGSISQLAIDNGQGAERELVVGLGKPVGLAVSGDRLIVTDQNTAQVMSYSLSDARVQSLAAGSGQVLATFTTLDGLDLMTAAPDGTVYMGGSGGTLYQIEAKGSIKVLAKGWPGIRGVAVDADNRRLFVAVASAQANDPSSIRIVPLD